MLSSHGKSVSLVGDCHRAGCWYPGLGGAEHHHFFRVEDPPVLIGTRPGKHRKSYWKWWFIVDFPIKHGDFPVSYVNVYQRVNHHGDHLSAMAFITMLDNQSGGVFHLRWWSCLTNSFGKQIGSRRRAVRFKAECHQQEMNWNQEKEKATRGTGNEQGTLHSNTCLGISTMLDPWVLPEWVSKF